MRQTTVLLLATALSASLVFATTGCQRDISVAVSADNSVAAAKPLDVAAEDWPWWRGPDRNGHAAESDPPLAWGEQQNVVWSSPVPGRGHGSPTICDGRIFLASAEEENQTQMLLCYDQASGKQQWAKTLHRGNFDHKHAKNSHASATPACDGERVFISFLNDAGVQVTALDFEGNQVWQTTAGPFGTKHGYGPSPVLYQSLVIIAGDSQGPGSFLAALHRETGDIVWRTDRPSIASFSTPVVAEVAGRPQLLISGTGQTCSYDPETGKLIWSVNGPAQTTSCTMAFGEDLVYASGGYPEKRLLAISAAADGAGEGKRVVWEKSGASSVTYVPSPLLAEGLLYVLSDSGVLNCYDAATGKQQYKERLGGNYSASLMKAGPYLFACSEEGKTTIFKAGPTYDEVATNTLPGGHFATPVVLDGKLYLRTTDRLHCVGK